MHLLPFEHAGNARAGNRTSLPARAEEGKRRHVACPEAKSAVR